MLKRKMLRDMKKDLSQFITIFLMVLIGVMVYTGIEAYMLGMTDSANKFYEDSNLFDLQVIGNNFTKKDIDDTKKIDGVTDAERKLSVTGKTNDDKTLLINFIESNNISKFYIIDGVEFDKDKKGVWLDEYYAKENNIHVGDTILVKYDTLSLSEPVLGIINVADHLYDTMDESSLYPDRKEFGFAYLSINEISLDYIAKLVGDENQQFINESNYKDYYVFNYMMVSVDDKKDVNLVKNTIEDKIDDALAVVFVEDTLSYSTYQGEIDEGKTYVGVFSGLFIFIAMLSVITTMSRVVKNQRIQIGTLKALGFSNFRVLLHYMGYGFYVSLLGAICGLILGYYGIGNFFMHLQKTFFEIPIANPSMNQNSYIVALIVVIAVVIITYITGISILRENPANTLRSEVPEVKKNSLNLTRKKMFRKMNFSAKWNIRDMLRNKIRTLMGIVGVSGCTMLIVCAIGMLNSMNYFVKLQFEDLYNFSYKLVLGNNISDKQYEEVLDKYGDNTSMSLNIEIKNGDRRESNNIFVNDSNGKVRFINRNNKYIELDRDDGVYVTYKLAEENNYKIGDKITWHVYGDSKYYESKIVGFNKDPQNQNVTMTRKYLESIGIKYKADSVYTNTEITKGENISGVELVQDRDNLKESMSNMLSTMRQMIILIIFIAIFLGTIIIYNLGILSYSEKKYQFATLKVLGFDDKKIKNVSIWQNNWIAVIGILIGLPLGKSLTNWLFMTAIDEHYDFSAHIEALTYILAGFGTFLVSYIVSRYLSRRIKNIDMVSSLKSNE